MEPVRFTQNVVAILVLIFKTLNIHLTFQLIFLSIISFKFNRKERTCNDWTSSWIKKNSSSSTTWREATNEWIWWKFSKWNMLHDDGCGGRERVENKNYEKLQISPRIICNIRFQKTWSESSENEEKIGIDEKDFRERLKICALNLNDASMNEIFRWFPL